MTWWLWVIVVSLAWLALIGLVALILGWASEGVKRADAAMERALDEERRGAPRGPLAPTTVAVGRALDEERRRPRLRLVARTRDAEERHRAS
jgi:hypothetical protein